MKLGTQVVEVGVEEVVEFDMVVLAETLVDVALSEVLVVEVKLPLIEVLFH